jgi:SAM-dependent methyltransferase
VAKTIEGFPIQFSLPGGFQDASDVPVWNGRAFSIGRLETPVLSYDVGQSGWTSDLTAFHEDVAPDHYMNRASVLHTLHELSRSVTSNSPTIIDIGCSSGYMLEALQREMPAARIAGADYVREPLQALASKLPGIPLLQFDLTKCPLPDACVDAVTLLNVLEHIERDDLALAHVRRILKPGGVAVIEVPAAPQLYDVYDQLLLHYRRYRMSELLKKIKQSGLEVVSRSHLGFFLYPAFWIVKKRGRRYLHKAADLQKTVVSRNITTAGSHPLMHSLMSFEARLRRHFKYPFGIRCLVTCRKI